MAQKGPSIADKPGADRSFPWTTAVVVVLLMGALGWTLGDPRLVAKSAPRVSASAFVAPVAPLPAPDVQAQPPFVEHYITAEDAGYTTTEPTHVALTSAPPRRLPRNCTEARAMGIAPMYRGDWGYAAHMDGDNDGIACEPYYGRRR